MANKCFGLFISVMSRAKYPLPPAPKPERRTVLHLGSLVLLFGVSSKYISLTTEVASTP